MAISIDWQTKIITVPQADLSLVSGSLYELDTDAFRLALKALEDSEEGMLYPNTHVHNTEVTVAGVTFARTIEIVNGYSVTFDPDAAYTVKLVGSNNNIFDVESGILNQNGVSVIAGNSAGLINTGLTAADILKLDELWRIAGLDESNPLVVTKTARTAGDIDQTIAGDGENLSTVTRNP